MELKNENDDEQPQGEVEPQPLDVYHGGPHDVSVLTKCHVHVAYRLSEGVVRFNNFNFFITVFLM